MVLAGGHARLAAEAMDWWAAARRGSPAPSPRSAVCSCPPVHWIQELCKDSVSWCSWIVWQNTNPVSKPKISVRADPFCHSQNGIWGCFFFFFKMRLLTYVGCKYLRYFVKTHTPLHYPSNVVRCPADLRKYFTGVLKHRIAYVV